MRRELLEHLVCPACRDALDVEPEREQGDHVMTGVLRCRACGAAYAVHGGVPRMNRAMDDLAGVARTFSYEWGAHHAGTLEDGTLFGRTEEEDWELFRAGTRLDQGDLGGLTVLDAGCGSARLSRQMADLGAQVIALDMSDAVDGAFARYRDVANLHIVQGNLLRAPVRHHAFGLVWSNGVIHHTPDARGAFEALTGYVRPGGRLFVWVYPNRVNPFRWTKRALDAVGLNRLSERSIMRIARAISYPSVALLDVYRLARRLPGLRPHGAWARSTVRRRTLSEVQLTWNDALAPRYNSWHTDGEVVGWFRAAGFTRIAAVDEPKVGVSGSAPGAPAGGESSELEAGRRDRAGAHPSAGRPASE
jgi:SAM-dependent methyltransferase